jgi:hypothetical protein
MSETAKRRDEPGVILPKPPAPAGNSGRFAPAGTLLFICGHLPPAVAEAALEIKP